MRNWKSLLLIVIGLTLISSVAAFAAGSTTTVASSKSPSCTAQSVTFTATVTKASGPNTPTGTVTFLDGGSSIGTGVLSGSGGTATATLSTSALAARSHSITASYPGDANFTPSTSSAITQLVDAASPSVTGQPANQSVCSGTSASFTVVATGSDLSYQWRKAGANLANGGSISGATSATLTINPVAGTDASTYDVVVTNGCGSATSTGATLTVTAAPSISVQPSAQAVCVGGTATYAVTAAGAGLTYQWRKNGVNIADGPTGNGSTYSGATTNSLQVTTVAAADAAIATAGFDCVVSGTCPPPVTSTRVALTINTAPAITVQPTDQTSCSGTTTTFAVTATGGGLTYQWRKNGVNIANGATGNGSTYVGVTTASMQITATAAGDAVSAATGFDCVVSGTCTPSPVTSDRVALTVNTSPAITGQPAAQTVCAGTTATYTVTATGTSLTYQWRKNGVAISNGVNGNGSTYSGVTTSSLQISGVASADAAIATAGFDCVVSGACTPAVTSSRVALTVNTAPAITVQPTASTVCAGSTASFTVTATGAGLTYQWRKNGAPIANGATGNGSTYSGATTVTLQITGTVFGDSADASTGFDCVVSGTCSPSATSTRVALTVNSAPSITGQPVAQTVCAGTTASFTVTATGAGLTYQWRKNGTALNN